MPTGRPLALRCGKCKRGEYWGFGVPRPSGENLLRTGRTRIARRYGRRFRVRVTEVRHVTCGHIFWTDHHSASALPLAAHLA